ncbi:hypothetical protein FOA52_008807 [Chlamydomonas sp. UWO 241]|nr:hypothetical protein FOA52_008807 [Chlamydomonas sp. UWO 241]
MQHEEISRPNLLDHMDALWPSLGTEGRRALRECCTALRDAVDAHASSLEGQDNAPLFSPTTCARLKGVHTLTLRSMACLRAMLVASPQQQPGAFFPRLQSLRLILDGRGVTIQDPAVDYPAIASTAPWLTQLSLKPPASATALPQEMAGLLSACSKLEELALDGTVPAACEESRLVDIVALAAASHLLRLRLISCSCLTNLAPLTALANLRNCRAVSDLAHLTALANLQSLDISSCHSVSDLVPLSALENLHSLDICGCNAVSYVAPLAALANLHSLDISSCGVVSDLAPLRALVKLRFLGICYCDGVSDLAPLVTLAHLQSLSMCYCRGVSDLAPLGALVKLQSLDICCCVGVSDLAPLAAMVKLQQLNASPFCGWSASPATPS